MEGSRKPRYRSDALEVLHETVSGLYRHGVIDEAILLHFDDGCLMPINGQDTTSNGPDKPPA